MANGLLGSMIYIENLDLIEIALRVDSSSGLIIRTPTYDKLDRVLVSVEWEKKCPLVRAHALQSSIYNHTPVL